MNWKKVLLASLILIAFCVSSVMAIEGGNSRKGKHLFKKNCKSCHSAGGEGGEITPMSKTMSQWDRFFEKGKHPGDTLETLETRVHQTEHRLLVDTLRELLCSA